MNQIKRNVFSFQSFQPTLTYVDFFSFSQRKRPNESYLKIKQKEIISKRRKPVQALMVSVKVEREKIQRFHQLKIMQITTE